MSKKRRHKKFVSAAVRVANQANAQLSTGPRTEAGKAIAAMNARKHGFTAKHFVIAPGEEGHLRSFPQRRRRRHPAAHRNRMDVLRGHPHRPLEHAPRRSAEVHLFQATGFDPLRNPDPEIEKRHKR
jgi:hypothetical protein